MDEQKTLQDVEDLISFLRQRGLADAYLEMLRNDKIDFDAIAMMDDDAMKAYIPAFGDRLAAVALGRKKRAKGELADTSGRLSRIKRRRGARVNSSNYASSSTRLPKEQQPDVELKRIELGWKHYDVQSRQFKQVRSQNGGGSRPLRVNVRWGKEDLIKEGKSLFFHKGKSSKGCQDELFFTAQDFRNIEIEDQTIGEIYEATRVKLLRVYVCTRMCSDTLCQDDEDSEIHLGKYLGCASDTSFELGETVLVTSTPKKLDQQDQAEGRDETPSSKEGVDVEVINVDVLPDFGSLSGSDCPNFDVVQLDWEPIEDGSDVSNTQGAILIQPYIASGPNTGEGTATANFRSPSSSAQASGHQEPTQVQINRICIQSEMVAIFKTPEIITTPIKIAFRNEEGADQKGLSRDAYTSFWKQFFENSADGEDVRVPALNPQYGLEEWQSVGRILVKGYLDVNFFPIQLAPAFFGATLFGEESLSHNDLLKSFMSYLSYIDREVVNQALNGEEMSEENKDAFHELLDREGCHSIPTKEGVRQTVQQLAHKCLIQNSSYPMEVMQSVVKEPLIHLFPTMDSVRDMYSMLQPTVQKVCRLLEANPQSTQEAQAFRFLGQYIRSRDSSSLAHLLQFLTGSSVMSVSKIAVTFTDSSGFGRMPVAHTCGPALELPATYTSYREFRSEWDNIIASGYLKMDIA